MFILILWRVFLTGVRIQIYTILAEPIDFLLTVVISPICYSISFLFIFQHVGKLAMMSSYGILGPVVLSIWANAVLYSGELIDLERANNTLELLIATPSTTPEMVLLGRILANTILSLISLVETILIAWIGFGVTLHITSLRLFIAGLLVLVLSTSAAALVMANTFILARSTRLFQTALTFPFYLLSGLAFPLGTLPNWLRAFSPLIALSWGSELLQQSVSQPPEHSPLVCFFSGLLLSCLYLFIGHYLFVLTEKRIRDKATLGSY